MCPPLPGDISPSRSANTQALRRLIGLVLKRSEGPFSRFRKLVVGDKWDFRYFTHGVCSDWRRAQHDCGMSLRSMFLLKVEISKPLRAHTGDAAFDVPDILKMLLSFVVPGGPVEQ